MLQAASVPSFDHLPCLPIQAAGKRWMPWELADASQTIFNRASLGDSTIQELFMAEDIRSGKYKGVDEQGSVINSADEYYAAYSYRLSRRACIALHAASKGDRIALYYVEAGIE